jgi:hypothetical protein
MQFDAAHAVARKPAAAVNYALYASNASAIITSPFIRLRARDPGWKPSVLWLPSLTGIKRALDAIVVDIAGVFDRDEVPSSIAPELLAVAPDLR